MTASPSSSTTKGKRFQVTHPADALDVVRRPEFVALQGNYDWLNKQLFVANLTTTIAADKRLASRENENDRLFHVYQLA